MLGLQVLDIALGMIFIYLLLSLVCTAGTELIASIFRLRAKTLVEGITKLLHDPAIGQKFFEHPLIKSLEIRGRKPTHIPPETFRLAISNILAGQGTVKSIPEAVAALEKLPPDSELRSMLAILVDEARGDFNKLLSNVETLFNNSMDRVSAWYKSKAQTITFFVALVIACVANADTIQITRALSNDPALRDALVAQAQEYAKQGAPTSVKIDQTLQGIEQLGIPLGWNGPPDNWVTKIVGLSLSILAMTLGAPFWFDLLKKVVTIRNAAKEAVEEQKPEESKT